MYNILASTHSGLRWIVLGLLIVALISGIMGLMGKKEFGNGHRKIALFAMISYHLQWTIGIVMYFLSPKVSFAAGFMGDTNLRFYSVEHILGMIIAMLVITVGYRKVKDISKENSARFSSLAKYYGVALLIVLASIPWPFRIAGAGWF